MLAVTGGKGGSGKTTTALGVAGALAERRREPLVVDCDLDAPNLHLRADTPRDPGLTAPNPVEAAHPSPRLPGVDVLPVGDADDTHLDATLDQLPDELGRLPDDRPVLLDCPAGASEAAARPLRAADGCIVVATSGRESLEDAVKTAEMARAVDTPLRAVAVNREPTVPDGLPPALGTNASNAVAVPDVTEPLESPDATASYARLADAASRMVNV